MHVAHDLFALARMAWSSAAGRAPRWRFIAAIERWRPSSSVALAIVSLPMAAVIVALVARGRFSSTAGGDRLLGDDQAAGFRRAASARGGRIDGLGGSPVARRGFGSGGLGLGGLGRLLLGERPRSRCSWISARARRRRFPSRRSQGELGLERRRRLEAPSACARPGVGGLTAFSRRWNSASLKFCETALVRIGGGRGTGAGLGDDDALALVLDRDRFGPAVAEASGAHGSSRCRRCRRRARRETCPCCRRP